MLSIVLSIVSQKYFSHFQKQILIFSRKNDILLKIKAYLLQFYDKAKESDMEKNEFFTSCDAVANLHFPRWHELPEFELYMDQVIGLVEKYLRPLYPENKAPITPSMINNYVKQRILPPPENKRYGKKHLACTQSTTAQVCPQAPQGDKNSKKLMIKVGKKYNKRNDK